MKRSFILLASAILMLGFVACNNKPEEPEAPAYCGDWYLNRAMINLDISAMGQNYVQDIDTAFTDRSQLFTLDPNSTVRVNGDSIGTYVYDELEGTLIVHTNKIKEMMGGDMVSQFIQVDLTTLQFNANFTDKAAKISYETAESGAVSVITYSYDIKMQYYFER